VSTTATAPPVAEHEHSLARKSIGFWSALAMSVEAMGPILGALSVAPLIVLYAGFSAPFIVLIGWIAMFIVAYVIARFTRALPSAASIYTYISHGLGERLGFMSAWLSFMYYFLFPPSLMIGLGLYGQSMGNFVFSVDIAWYWWAIAGGLIAFGLSILGIRLSMRVDLVLAIIADVVLLAVSVGIIAKVINDGNFTLEPFLPTHAHGGFTGLSLSIAFGVLIFLGFEQSFTLGEEVEDPRGDVPKAIFWSLGGIGLLLLLSTFAMVIGFGATGMGQLETAFSNDGTPFWQLIHTYLSSGWRDALQIVAVTSVLGNLIASHNCVVRIQYGMGRAGAFPKQMGYTLPSSRSPYVAIVFQTICSLAIVIGVAIWWNVTTAFGFISFIEGLAAAAAFVLIMAAGVRYFHRIAPTAGALRNWIIPLVGIVILVPAIYTSFYPNPGYPLNRGPWVIVGWLVVGGVYLIWRVSQHKQINIDYAFGEIGESGPPPEVDPHTEPEVAPAG
jgi:amino acid transporter